MYTKIYHMKFATMAEAKVAVSYLTEEIGGSIAEIDCASLNINLAQDGTVNITTVFDTPKAMKAFDDQNKAFIENLKATFLCRMQDYSAVSVFNFEREANPTVM